MNMRVLITGMPRPNHIHHTVNAWMGLTSLSYWILLLYYVEVLIVIVVVTVIVIVVIVVIVIVTLTRFMN